MNAKLTLNPNKNIIEEEKLYAKENKKISPLVESLTGVIPDMDERKGYRRDYLVEKYA